MKYIYGPVKSRRLGLSLGVSPLPYKICSFNCVYCQLGRTENLSVERKEYLPPEEIIAELESWLQSNKNEEKRLNYITLSGLGEPTLNIKIADLISKIKKITLVPVAVITNASLLNLLEVRQALNRADLIVPSLDAVSPSVFKRINRPLEEIKIEGIIEGLVNLRREFRGQIWLEVMLLSGINDDLRQIRKLKDVVDRINPDKIQLNSPVRTTAEPNLLSVDKNKLEEIKEILGERCEII